MGGSPASKVTYTLESSLDSVNRVEQTGEELARKAGLEEEEIYRVAMAVREAAVNAVLHGNAYDPEKNITASFEQTADSLVIRIADQGKGLNPIRCPTRWRPRICCAAQVEVSFSSAPSWMRYTFVNCSPALNLPSSNI